MDSFVFVCCGYIQAGSVEHGGSCGICDKYHFCTQEINTFDSEILNYDETSQAVADLEDGEVPF